MQKLCCCILDTGHPISWDLTVSEAAELEGSVPLTLQFTSNLFRF